MMTICKTTVHVPHSPHLTTGTDGDVSCRFLPILPWFYMHWLVLGFMQFYQMCRFVYPQGCLLLSFYKHVHPPTPFAHSLTRGDHKSVCFSNFGMFYEWNNIQCNLSKLALSTNPDALEDLPKLSTCQHTVPSLCRAVLYGTDGPCFCLTVLLLKGVSSVGRLWIKPNIHTWALNRRRLTLLWDKCPRVQVLGRMWRLHV